MEDDKICPILYIYEAFYTPTLLLQKHSDESLPVLVYNKRHEHSGTPLDRSLKSRICLWPFKEYWNKTYDSKHVESVA